MIEGILYGVVVSLAFIGIISLIYFLILHTFRPKDNGRFIIRLTDELTELQIYDLIFSAYLRNFLYGGAFCADIILVDLISDAEKRGYISEIINDFKRVKVVKSAELMKMFE